MDTPKKNYFNVRPAVIITAGLIFGILAGYAYLFLSVYLWAFILFGGLLLGVVITCYLIITKRNFYAVIVLFTMLTLVVGALIITVTALPNFTTFGNSTFSGVVVDVFSEQKLDGGYLYSIIAKGNFLTNENAKVYLSFFSSDRIYQGTKIYFSGYFTLSELSNFTLSTGAHYSANISEGSLLFGEIDGAFNELKFRLLTAFENTTGDTCGLNYAIFTGHTQYANNSVISKYQNLGIAHVFAVSGLHIGLMYLALDKFIKLFSSNETSAFMIVTGVLLLYVGFCGFTPSALRAFIIITVRNFARLLGEKPDGSTNIAISAFIVLCVNPSDLLSVGFLLSYSVYAGLILLTKPFAKVLEKVLFKRVAEVLSPCLVAQAVSFPLLIDFFGYASLFSFIFNLVIIPLIGFFFPLLLAFTVLLLIFPTGWIFGVILRLFFTAIEFGLSFINTEIFMIESIRFSYSMAFYYLLLYSFANKFNFSKRTTFLLRIIILILTVLLFSIINIALYY